MWYTDFIKLLSLYNYTCSTLMYCITYRYCIMENVLVNSDNMASLEDA